MKTNTENNNKIPRLQHSELTQSSSSKASRSGSRKRTERPNQQLADSETHVPKFSKRQGKNKTRDTTPQRKPETAAKASPRKQAREAET